MQRKETVRDKCHAIIGGMKNNGNVSGSQPELVIVNNAVTNEYEIVSMMTAMRNSLKKQ